MKLGFWAEDDSGNLIIEKQEALMDFGVRPATGEIDTITEATGIVVGRLLRDCMRSHFGLPSRADEFRKMVADLKATAPETETA